MKIYNVEKDLEKAIINNQILDRLKTSKSPFELIVIQQNYIQKLLFEILKHIDNANYILLQIGIYDFYVYQINNSRKENYDALLKQHEIRVGLHSEIKEAKESNTLGRLIIIFTKQYKEKNAKDILKQLNNYTNKRNDIIHHLFDKNFKTFDSVNLFVNSTISDGNKIVSILEKVKDAHFVEIKRLLEYKKYKFKK